MTTQYRRRPDIVDAIVYDQPSTAVQVQVFLANTGWGKTNVEVDPKTQALRIVLPDDNEPLVIPLGSVVVKTGSGDLYAMTPIDFAVRWEPLP